MELHEYLLGAADMFCEPLDDRLLGKRVAEGKTDQEAEVLLARHCEEAGWLVFLRSR